MSRLTEDFWTEVKAAPVAAALGIAYLTLVIYVFWIGIETIIAFARAA